MGIEDRDWYRSEARNRFAKADAASRPAWNVFESRPTANKARTFGLRVGPLGWVIVIAAVSLTVAHSIQASDGLTQIAATFVDEHFRRAIDFPVNGYTKLYFDPAYRSLAPLTIQTSPETPDLKTVVSVRDWSTGTRLASVFLEASSIITINLPAGFYKFVIATRKDWFGDESLFGQMNQVQRSLRPLELRADSGRTLGQTIQLLRTDRPNFPTEAVSRGEIGEP